MLSKYGSQFRVLLRLSLMALLVMSVTVGSYLVGFLSGSTVGSPPAATETSVTPSPTLSPSLGLYEEFHLLTEAMRILQDEYYSDVPNSQQMNYIAIRSVLDQLNDPYTAFLDPAHAQLLRGDRDGTFEGIGATVEMRDGQLVIVTTFASSPARNVGLKTGDVILSVNDVRIENMTVMDAVELIRGPEGSTVELTIDRSGLPQPFTVEIVRDEIDLPLIESKLLEGDIAYVKLYQFRTGAGRQVQEVLKKLLQKDLAGLILDLRDNPGGFLHEAVAVGSQFINESVILIERREGGNEEIHRARRGGVALETPLVVLVNGGTASASEIVAGAIQDHDRGTLIGDATFGKGSVQVVHTLSDESSLRVTIARWLTPDRRSIDEGGLTPDIQVKLADEQEGASQDVQLDRAIEYLRGGE